MSSLYHLRENSSSLGSNSYLHSSDALEPRYLYCGTSTASKWIDSQPGKKIKVHFSSAGYYVIRSDDVLFGGSRSNNSDGRKVNCSGSTTYIFTYITE